MNTEIRYHCNPINQVDPFGLSPIEDDKITVKDFIHTVFDVIGFFWDGADLINGIMYLMEGNTLMASTSLVAAIPFAGSVVASGSKLAFKGSKYAAKACKAAEYIKDTTKLIGYTGQTALSAGVTLSSYQSYKKNRAEGKSTGGDVLNMAIGTIATVAGAGGAISSAKKMSAKLARDGVGEAVKKATKEALGNNRGTAKLIGGEVIKTNYVKSSVNDKILNNKGVE